MPSGNNNQSSSSEPPAKPGESSSTSDNTNSNTTTTTQENLGSSTSLESAQRNTSENQNSSQPNNSQMPQGQMQQSENGSVNISTIYYVLFTIEALVVTIMIVYLIMSKFNKLTFKETITGVDKKIIFVLLTIIITGALTYTQTILTQKVFANNNQTQQIQMIENGQGSNQSSSQSEASGETTISEDKTEESSTYESTESGKSAILVTDGTSTISNATVTKSGDSSDENADFYGTNAGVLVTNGTLNISSSNITTNGSHANAVFAYNQGKINISDSTINTTSNNSGAIMVAGGGTLTATNVTATTQGNSSATIRSDRGGGTMTVNGGSFTTSGVGSPAIYSTADITVNDASLTSTASEGVVVEGANSVTLNNVKLTDTNTTLNGNSETYKNIFLYQSMSGDADQGTATFSASNSNITTNKGDTIFVTNTTATITLENNTITNNDSEGGFLRIQAGKWGTSGSNGGNVTLNLNNQAVTGNIYVDNISTLSMNLTSGSSYTGTINGDNTAKSIALKLDSSSSITLTGDCYVTSLEDTDTSYSNINFNGYKLYVNNVAIN